MLTAYKVSVGTAAVDLLNGIDADRGLEIYLSGGPFYVGDSAVTVNTGFPVSGSVPLRIDLHGETIYAVTSLGGSIANVLVVGVK